MTPEKYAIQTSVSVNNRLLKHTHMHSFTYSPVATGSELHSCHRGLMAHKAQIIFSLLLSREFADFLLLITSHGADIVIK